MEYPKTMKALVAYGKGDYRYEPEYPVPECGPDELLMKTEGCGICASDLKCEHGAAMYWGDEDTPGWVEAPFIPGHEFLGRVVYTGENIKDYKPGDRITVEQIAPCNECRFCQDGHYWMCQPHKMYGYFTEFHGGMAEYVLVKTQHSKIHHVPDSLPLKAAVLIEPYSCSKHAVDRANISGDDIVVIAGAGTLGLGMVTYARMRNPKKLIVLDTVRGRLEKAKEFGADSVWNPMEQDVTAEIMKLTDGYGCDVYIEATGNPASVAQGMKMIRKLGRFIEFSVFKDPALLDWSVIGDRKELDVLGSHLGPYCYPFVIENMAKGTLKTTGVVSSTFPIERWEEAFDFASGKYGDFKVAITFE